MSASECRSEDWEIVTADDGRIFIAEAGDIVCHTDPNHAADDAADRRRFRLIAAAPDLLEALRYLVMHCKSFDRFEGHPINEAIRAARDAIAKAEPRA